MKKWVRSILILAAAVILAAAFTCRWFLQPPVGTVVLAYHAIEDVPFSDAEHLFVTPEEFENQIKWLKRAGYEFIFADEMKMAWDEKVVCITFDDGYKDNLTEALPILEKYGVKATIFIATKHINFNQNFLSEDEAKTLAASPYIRIGSHTDGHYMATGLTDEDFRKQLDMSQTKLEQLTGYPVRSFAYPGGYFNKAKSAIAGEYFDYCYTYPGAPFCVSTQTNMTAIPRITVERGTGPFELLRTLRTAGYDPCMEQYPL